jgi:hypothetical protein
VLQKYCCFQCRRAVRRVIERERRWLDRAHKTSFELARLNLT